jgi:hypothetical protein
MRGFVDLDVDSLERRPQQRAERVVVIDQQEAQNRPPLGLTARPFGRVYE